MTHQVFNPTPRPTTPADEVRDLVAAMPIVIFARALRAAFQRSTYLRATLRTSGAR